MDARVEIMNEFVGAIEALTQMVKYAHDQAGEVLDHDSNLIFFSAAGGSVAITFQEAEEFVDAFVSYFGKPDVIPDDQNRDQFLSDLDAVTLAVWPTDASNTPQPLPTESIMQSVQRLRQKAGLDNV